MRCPRRVEDFEAGRVVVRDVVGCLVGDEGADPGNGFGVEDVGLEGVEAGDEKGVAEFGALSCT